MTTPAFIELEARRKALSSVVSARWAAMIQQREQALELMCSARAEIARALGVQLDEEGDVCRYCESALQPAFPGAPLPEAARLAFEQLGQAVKAAFTSDELLQEMMAAYAQERELSRHSG